MLRFALTKNEDGVRFPGRKLITWEDLMATNKAPTKADFLAALEKKGIKSLEDLIDALMPESDETGGYVWEDAGGFDPADGDIGDAAKIAMRKWRGNTDWAEFGRIMMSKWLDDIPGI